MVVVVERSFEEPESDKGYQVLVLLLLEEEEEASSFQNPWLLRENSR